MSLARSVLVICACFALLGCVTATYFPPQGIQAEYERVVNKPFDQAWSILIDHTTRTFFSIDRFEKDSGLMTLSFGVSEPWLYVDCGHFKSEGLAGTIQIDAPYARYLAERFGAKLDGKMNLVVRAITDATTLIRISARYILTLPGTSATPTQSWVFDSGKTATIDVYRATPGIASARTCRPTYRAERSILEALSK